MGVIFETGSAKYVKFTEDGCQFHSSWEYASRIEYSKWSSTSGNRENMIDFHGLKHCSKTLVFLELIYDTKLDCIKPDFSSI